MTTYDDFKDIVTRAWRNQGTPGALAFDLRQVDGDETQVAMIVVSDTTHSILLSATADEATVAREATDLVLDAEETKARAHAAS
jgi:hypothetical protein